MPQPHHPESPSPPRPGDSYGVLPRPCRALVLLNPQSGTGRALEDFQAVVQPMLAEADVATTVFITGESMSGSLTSSSSLSGILLGAATLAWVPLRVLYPQHRCSSGSCGAGLDNTMGDLVALRRGDCLTSWIPSWDPRGDSGAGVTV